jgi:putative pyruvate formate lyase activating enzyme
MFNMWRLVRPDSSRVWKNPEVLRRLKRYRSIIDDAKTAKYLLSKDMVCEFDKQSTTEELWNEHARLSDEFREYVSAVDSNKSRYNLENAEAASFLDLKIELAQRVLQNCHFCERKCGADRTIDDSGWCRLGEESRVSSAFLHTGEEAPLVPSGTIFFSSCCFGCVFCQNADISTNPRSGQVVTPQELAVIAQALRRDGAININYVGGDPIPNTHTIIASLAHQTVNVTQLWNSNLYCSEDTMSLLSDVFDVWLPDFKYGNNDCGERLSGVKEYFDIVSRNHLLAYKSGEVIIRHLVMPNHIECCTFPILDWVAANMPDCMVNIMAQYRPEHKVRRSPKDYPDIATGVASAEMQAAFDKADSLGICWRPVS